MQDLHGSIFGVAAETNHRGDVEIEFPKRLRETVRGPVLFLARNPEPEPKITHQIGLGQDDSRRAIPTFDADGLPLVSVKSAIVNPAFTIASIDIIEPPPPAP